MANRRTHEADFKKLACLIDLARGDRSLRRYARDAGVDHNVLFRIRNGTYNPGITVLQKLAGADPQNGVTAGDFLDAGGFSANTEALKKAFPIIVDVMKRAREEKWFCDGAWEVIRESLAAEGISYGTCDGNENSFMTFRPDISIKTENAPFKEIWFLFWKAFEDEGLIRSRATDIAADLIRRPVTVPADPLRKIVIVVDNPDVFEELALFAGGTMIRGFLSAVLVDLEEKRIEKETMISAYGGTDETDPMPLTKKRGV